MSAVHQTFGPSVAHRFIAHCFSVLCRHDTVFIDLSDKPEWYLKVFPEGLVPALVYKEKFLYESLLLADFLDEQYPEPPLYDSPLQKILDRIFIGSFGKVSVG